MKRPPRKKIPARVKLAAILIHTGRVSAERAVSEASRLTFIDREAVMRFGLLMLGIDPDKPIDWDHEPMLALRGFDPVTKLYTPDELDPAKLTPRQKDDHRLKTNGRASKARGATVANGDQHKAAKADRLEAETIAFRTRLLNPAIAEDERRTAKRSSFGSRPFPNRRKA